MKFFFEENAKYLPKHSKKAVFGAKKGHFTQKENTVYDKKYIQHPQHATKESTTLPYIFQEREDFHIENTKNTISTRPGNDINLDQINITPSVSATRPYGRYLVSIV